MSHGALSGGRGDDAVVADPGGGGGGAPPIGASEFAAVAAIMQSDARIHLTDVKRVLVQSRLSRRLRLLGLTTYRDYLERVRVDAAERAAMVVALTTNHTHFFRESHHFDHLRAELLPRLKARAQREPIRLWSAGCSSGEEVYTLAMCLLGTDRAQAAWTNGADLRLLATDIAPPMVEAVRRARYPAAAAEPVPEPYRRAWMTVRGDEATMADEARALVTAQVLNLFAGWPMRQRYDAIFCRNVMIYFDDAAKAELEARLVDMLKPDGFLYIGHSERLLGSSAHAMESCGQTIYRRRAGAAQ